MEVTKKEKMGERETERERESLNDKKKLKLHTKICKKITLTHSSRLVY